MGTSTDKQMGRHLDRARSAIHRVMQGAAFPVLAPSALLSAYFLGGEAGLLAAGTAIPLLYVLSGGLETPAQPARPQSDRVTGLGLAPDFQRVVAERLDDLGESDLQTGCFLVEIDEFESLRGRFGQAACDHILRHVSRSLRGALRDGDVLCRLGDSRLGIVLAPVSHLGLEAAIQLAVRLQDAVEEPLTVEATTIYVSVSVGFCQSTRMPGPDGAAFLAGATAALREAASSGPGAIRAFCDPQTLAAPASEANPDEAIAALENGQIVPFYQPQISTDTGRITGFEALARWIHPTRGMIAPGEFLPLFEAAGKLERLGEVIMYGAFAALREWDTAGLDVPYIGVNFAGEELRDPRLPDKIAWELDRFDLDPLRLSVEVLETVVSNSPDDVVTRNINSLARMGCRIDLDDFGTGNASITAIQRFAVQRIKIDRSFVMKVDRDPEQQRIVSAILTMAERLNLDTVAEGVETIGEHAMLAQLGCSHVQGFGVARPMPFDAVAGWVAAHNAKLAETPRIAPRRGKS